MTNQLHIELQKTEEETLYELARSSHHPRIRQRAEALRLSHSGLSVSQIAEHLHWNQQTVRNTFHRWQQGGLIALWDAPRSGRKPRWQEEDIEFLQSHLDNDQRAFNSRQLSELLYRERKVQLSADWISRILKKRKYRWKRTRASNKKKQDPLRVKNASLILKIMEEMVDARIIHLQYLDESGFSRWSGNCYTYAKRGEQKCLQQSKERGKRVSILGIWEKGDSFRYHLKLGSICQEEYLKILEAEAQKAKERWLKTGKVTFTVQDNSSVHWCLKVRERLEQWEKEGFRIFWLPPYASQLNRIEDEWHQIKAHEISGQMFDSDLSLLQGVHKGIENRYQKKGCTVVYYV